MSPRDILAQYRLPLVILGGGILIFVFIWMLVISPKNIVMDDSAITTRVNATLNVRRVFVKDFYQYQNSNDPHIKAHGSIENTLYTYASQGKPDLYTGIIRPNSFKKTGDKTSELLIDIEPAKVTYKITFLGLEKDNLKPTSIMCAPKDEQMNPDSLCVDGGQP